MVCVFDYYFHVISQNVNLWSPVEQWQIFYALHNQHNCLIELNFLSIVSKSGNQIQPKSTTFSTGNYQLFFFLLPNQIFRWPSYHDKNWPRRKVCMGLLIFERLLRKITFLSFQWVPNGQKYIYGDFRTSYTRIEYNDGISRIF